MHGGVLVLGCTGASEYKHYFHRFLESGIDSQAEQIVRMCEELHNKYAFVNFVIKPMPDKPMPQAKHVEFKNICGKIQHTKLCNLYKDEVCCYTEKVSNSFGNFLCLSSMECNFSMCQSRNFTLFRAGKNSTEIDKKIDLALNRHDIRDIFVHMIVCSAHLSNAVFCKHKCIIQRLRNTQLFTVTDNDELNESYITVCIKLTNFDASLLQTLSSAADIPKQVFINIGRFGSINLFLSLQRNTTFDKKLEQRFLPFCQNLINIIQDKT